NRVQFGLIVAAATDRVVDLQLALDVVRVMRDAAGSLLRGGKGGGGLDVGGKREQSENDERGRPAESHFPSLGKEMRANRKYRRAAGLRQAPSAWQSQPAR